MIYSEPKEIGRVIIKNRFVRSATYRRMAKEDGDISNELLEMYEKLAKGGVGLIITGYAYVQKSGISFPGQIGVDRDSLIPSLKKISKTIHDNGDGCKVFLQLAHCGRQSYFVDEIVAPSAVLEPITNRMPREMTIEEIEETVDAFAEASRRTMEAGFDGIQLHSAHGYLLSGFLSPHTNRRMDKYGGSINNRIRIFKEIYEKTTKLVGSDFPISIKMNADDYLEGGLKIDESKQTAEAVSKIGYASIEVSGAMWEVLMRSKQELGWQPAMIPESRININSKDKEAYHKTYANEFKKLIDKPIILVGGIKSLDVVEDLLTQGICDFVSLSRPFIREPDLPNKWLKGTGKNTCKCISCNGCIGAAMSGPVYCTQEK
jgi:2,4-dienoyl-CoA reductase-like NADH-dependent reductase (Old Yellow Enzyme family)